MMGTDKDLHVNLLYIYDSETIQCLKDHVKMLFNAMKVIIKCREIESCCGGPWICKDWSM